MLAYGIFWPLSDQYFFVGGGGGGGGRGGNLLLKREVAMFLSLISLNFLFTMCSILSRKCLQYQAPTYVSELTCYAGQLVYYFYLPNMIFSLPKISYNICFNMDVSLIIDSGLFLWICTHFLYTIYV